MNTTPNYYVFVLQEHAPIAELLDNFQRKGHLIDLLQISSTDVNQLAIPINKRVGSSTKDEKPKESTDTILYLRVDHIYVEIHMSQGRKVLKRSTLESAIQEFPDVTFIQTHRSYAVNLDAITQWNAMSIFIDDHEIPISRRRKKEVISLLKSKLK